MPWNIGPTSRGILARLAVESARVAVPTSDPQVACSVTEGPRASKDADTAIAHAKGTWAGIHYKTHSEKDSPAYLGKFEPYTATLRDGVWHVQGTVPSDFHADAPVMSLCRNDEGETATWIKVP
jgi:hypothetical protein